MAVTTRRQSKGDALAPASLADLGLTKAEQAPARFSLEEVAQHNSPTDCWLIVRRKVYDVTSWVPRHPGGDLIFVKAGRDCTHLFDSYHPLSTRSGSADSRPPNTTDDVVASRHPSRLKCTLYRVNSSIRRKNASPGFHEFRPPPCVRASIQSDLEIIQ